MEAIHTDLAFIDPSCCTPRMFRSVWERLCRQLFGAIPLDMDAGAQLPNIDIWKDSVVRQNDTEPYTFLVTTDEADSPKAADIIFYKGKYYVIGNVE